MDFIIYISSMSWQASWVELVSIGVFLHPSISPSTLLLLLGPPRVSACSKCKLLRAASARTAVPSSSSAREVPRSRMPRKRGVDVDGVTQRLRPRTIQKPPKTFWFFVFFVIWETSSCFKGRTTKNVVTRRDVLDPPR